MVKGADLISQPWCTCMYLVFYWDLIASRKSIFNTAPVSDISIHTRLKQFVPLAYSTKQYTCTYSHTQKITIYNLKLLVFETQTKIFWKSTTTTYIICKAKFVSILIQDYKLRYGRPGKKNSLDLLSFRCVNSLWKASKQYNTMPSGLIYLIEFFLVSCRSIRQSMECLIVDVCTGFWYSFNFKAVIYKPL